MDNNQYLRKPLEILELPLRIDNLLHRAKCHTVQDVINLLRQDKETFFNQKGVGSITVEQIEDKLIEKGIII